MDTPSLTDGRRGLKDPIVENLSVLVSGSPLKYHFVSHGLKRGGRVIEHEIEGEGVALGFDIRAAGPRKGPINIQLNRADDTPPNAAHVLKLTVGTNVGYFGVSEGDESGVRNGPKRLSVPVIEMVNPFFQGLLDPALGDTKQQTYSIATMGTTETITTNPQNHRSAATKAYTATLSDGSALPTGVAINASTGVITVTKATVVAGSYVIKVVASDILSTLPSDHPWYTLEGEATLLLTVTA